MKPLIDPINTSDGKFHGKDKQTGDLATIVTPEYMNNDQDATRSMQREIISILTAADIKPEEATDTQLLTALKKVLVTADDERVKNALQKGNNLSDVNDKAKARDSLELGSASTREVADNADGALVPVGYKGNFKSECNHGAIDFATYPFVVGESLFINAQGCTNNPPFLNQDFYYIDVVCATSPAQGGRVNRPLIQFVSYTNSTMIFAIREDDGSTIGWRYFRAVQFDADNQNVTLPGDVRARNGAIELSQSAIIIRGSGNKHLWFFNASGAEMGLVYASDDKVLHLRAGEGPSVNIQSNGNVVAPNYLEAKDDIHSGRNISSVGLIQAGAGLYDTPGVRAYSPNNPPPCPLPVGAILTMGNNTSPQNIYPGTAWQDLSSSYNGLVMQIATTALATGGSNTARLTADNLPPHAHRGGVGAGGAGVADFKVGTDNQGNYGVSRTLSTYTDSASGAEVTNTEFSVQNAFVSVKAWMRTA